MNRHEHSRRTRVQTVLVTLEGRMTAVLDDLPVTVSLETMQIVDSLPALGIRADQGGGSSG